MLKLRCDTGIFMAVTPVDMRCSFGASAVWTAVAAFRTIAQTSARDSPSPQSLLRSVPSIGSSWT